MPRRDVNGRIHVRMAGETAGSAHEPRLILTRVRVHLPARRAPLARERGPDLLHPARRFLRQPPRQQPPPRGQDPPVQPGLGPDVAARVLPRALRGPGYVTDPQSLTRITSNRRTIPVETFSAQSLRRSLSRAFSRAIACLTRPRRFDAPPPRRARCAAAAAAWPAPGAVTGQSGRVPGGQRCGDRHPPVTRSTALAVSRGGTGRGSPGRRRRAPARPVPCQPGPLHLRRTARPHGTHPPALRHPDQACLPGHPPHIPLPPAPDDPDPYIPPPALRTTDRPAGFAPGRRTPPHRPAMSRSACCCTVWEPAAAHGCSARAAVSCRQLLQVARRAFAARAPVGVLLDGEVPDVPGVAAVVPKHRFLGGGGEQPVPGHANILAITTDISGEVMRRFLPGLKAGSPRRISDEYSRPSRRRLPHAQADDQPR